MIKKLWLISKLKTSQTEPEVITIHILPNISIIKDNQTKNFGWLIECNMRNIFLVKWWTKCGGEACPRPFYKKVKIEHILHHQQEMIRRVFLYVQAEDLQNILKLRCWPLAFTLCKAFLINKKGSGTSLPSSFSAWFLKEKHLSCYILLTD